MHISMASPSKRELKIRNYLIERSDVVVEACIRVKAFNTFSATRRKTTPAAATTSASGSVSTSQGPITAGTLFQSLKRVEPGRLSALFFDTNFQNRLGNCEAAFDGVEFRLARPLAVFDWEFTHVVSASEWPHEQFSR